MSIDKRAFVLDRVEFELGREAFWKKNNIQVEFNGDDNWQMKKKNNFFFLLIVKVKRK